MFFPFPALEWTCFHESITTISFWRRLFLFCLSFLLALSLKSAAKICRLKRRCESRTMRSHGIAPYLNTYKENHAYCFIWSVCVCVVKCVCWSESITTCSQSHAVASISNAYCYRCYRLECVLLCVPVCVSLHQLTVHIQKSTWQVQLLYHKIRF